MRISLVRISLLRFFKIEVRPRACRSYHIWRPCTTMAVINPQERKLAKRPLCTNWPYIINIYRPLDDMEKALCNFVNQNAFFL